MDTALVQELEELLNETRELLAWPDSEVEAWEEYGEKREAIFARLKGMDFQGVGEKRALVCNLIEEILQQDTVVLERTRARLACLREELSLLAIERRALRSYAPPHPAILLERCA